METVWESLQELQLELVWELLQELLLLLLVEFLWVLQLVVAVAVRVMAGVQLGVGEGGMT